MKIPALGDIFDKPKAEPSTAVVVDGHEHDLFASTKAIYKIDELNWFSAKPYGFKFTNRSNDKFTMFLPISPSNLVISTHFATNTSATLYGTVEEHSPVRYYDIQIEGTTGMAPRFVDVNQKKAFFGRALFPVKQDISLGGFFAKTVGTVNNILNKISDLSGGSKPTTGLSIDQTGYLAFHNLYRFLLKYKQDASGVGSSKRRSGHPLTFFNYKDNNEYDVVVKNFVLKRSAENPMLYYYSITMRGYNIRSAGDNKDAVDQTQDRLAALGLNGIDSSSLLGKIKGTSNKVKGLLGSLGGGINTFGR